MLHFFARRQVTNVRIFIDPFIYSFAARARDARLEFEASKEAQNRTVTPEGHPELTNEEFQEVANIRRAKVLEFEARLLEGEPAIACFPPILQFPREI